jgi:hypothetical protein
MGVVVPRFLIWMSLGRGGVEGECECEDEGEGEGTLYHLPWKITCVVVSRFDPFFWERNWRRNCLPLRIPILPSLSIPRCV